MVNHHLTDDGSFHQHSRHYHHHKANPKAVLAFWILFFSMVASQFGLYTWKRRHYRSYQSTTLLGLLVFPISASLYYHYWRFVVTWLLFAGVTGYHVYQASRNPLPVTAPRRVYKWFSVAYRASYGTALAGYMCIMFDFFKFQKVFGLSIEVGQWGSLMLFYGLYYGVLDRDCAEMCADRIQQRLGYSKKGDDDAQRLLPDNVCALCGLDLRPLTELEDDETGAGEEVVELACGHTFHEFCARGWIMVGKKDVCPNCGDKVQMRSLLGGSPWDNQSLVWVHLLDALRYLIVWNPVILITMQVALNGMGLVGHPHANATHAIHPPTHPQLIAPN